MAKCECCGREMLTADGCSWGRIEINGKYFRRVKVGAPGGLDNGWITEGERCHDCGAKFGFLHHPGCDMEVCPNCGGQLAFCECEKGDLLLE